MTTTIRKSNLIANYLYTVDRLKFLAAELKQLEHAERAMRPDVLEKISADGSEVKIDGVVRTIVPQAKESTKPAVEPEALIEFADASGLPVAERSARWIPPATFSSWARKGLIPESMVDRTTEIVLIVR